MDMIHSIEEAAKHDRKELNWTIGIGFLSIVVGLIALLYAGVASVVATVTLGWVYILAGVSLIVLAFRLRKLGGFWSSFIFGVLFLVAGIGITMFPVQNTAFLTLIIGIVLGVTGITKIVGCFMERIASRGMLFLSGLVSLFCSAVIVLNWPLSGFWVIGTLVGVDLIFWGVTMISYATSAKKLIPKMA